MEVTSDQMVRFKDLVYRRSHLTFHQSREPQLRRWIVQLASEGKYRTFEEYYHALSSDAREFEQLLVLITTRETYFYRMPNQFEVLRNVVLPEIVEREGMLSLQSLSRKEPYRMRLHVWSAGCATGQETYSLSMQILETLRYPKAWDITVLGTDINPDALETARAGLYDATRLGSMPPQIIERYCGSLSAQKIILSDEVKAITKFQVMNLRNLSEQAFFKSAFDIIFCRNVMIYFDLPAQQQLVTALSACLKPGGHLFTGEGEVLHLYQHELEVMEKDGCIWYRRPKAT
jgi:chemotaxis protein methyltransferase CheR